MSESKPKLVEIMNAGGKRVKRVVESGYPDPVKVVSYSSKLSTGLEVHYKGDLVFDVTIVKPVRNADHLVNIIKTELNPIIKSKGLMSYIHRKKVFISFEFNNNSPTSVATISMRRGESAVTLALVELSITCFEEYNQITGLGRKVTVVMNHGVYKNMSGQFKKVLMMLVSVLTKVMSTVGVGKDFAKYSMEKFAKCVEKFKRVKGVKEKLVFQAFSNFTSKWMVEFNL